MIDFKRPSGQKLGMFALGVGAMIMGLYGGEQGMNAMAGNAQVRCEIEVREMDNGVQLQGVVFADETVQGAYEMQISKFGHGSHSKINQAGDFDARPNIPAKLGGVRLGGDGGAYEARLKVVWDGEEIECEKNIGGGWL